MREIKILDVRSPREYQHAHIPHALSFPVLNDQEYEEIGTLYRLNSFEAKIRGSAYICKNIATFLEQSNIFHPSHKLILYCARGGQRSKSLWSVLREIGFDCERLEGGYKQYRQEVLKNLSIFPSQTFFTLYGMTGSGKSDLIKMAHTWSIDLEKMSGHYGSSFGHQANDFMGQPSHAMFENLLEYELRSKRGIVLIEGESKKIGNIVIPNVVFDAMHRGKKILIQTCMEERVKRIVKMYAHISYENFIKCMQKIKPYLQRQLYNDVLFLWDCGDKDKIALILLEKYYDRVYRKNQCDIVINAENLDLAYQELCSLKEEMVRNS